MRLGRVGKKTGMAAVAILAGLVTLGVANWPRFRDRKLLYAADSGDTAAVRLWLRLGGDLKAQLYPGVTPLMCAARHGHIDTLRVLLDQGANPNFTENIWYVTPLMYAVQSRDPGVVQMLLDRGADPTPADSHEKTALMCALEGNNQDIADALRHAGAVR